MAVAAETRIRAGRLPRKTRAAQIAPPEIDPTKNEG
jgi:hypothetical protein